MEITASYAKSVGVPDDCRPQEFGDPTCPAHRDATDLLAYRHAEAVATVVAATVLGGSATRVIAGSPSPTA